MNNSSHAIGQDLDLLSAQQNLAKAKAAQGIQMQLNAEVGLIVRLMALHQLIVICKTMRLLA